MHLAAEYVEVFLSPQNLPEVKKIEHRVLSIEYSSHHAWTLLTFPLPAVEEDESCLTLQRALSSPRFNASKFCNFCLPAFQVKQADVLILVQCEQSALGPVEVRQAKADSESSV